MHKLKEAMASLKFLYLNTELVNEDTTTEKLVQQLVITEIEATPLKLKQKPIKSTVTIVWTAKQIYNDYCKQTEIKLYSKFLGDTTRCSTEISSSR